jgi:hypothetical protein
LRRARESRRISLEEASRITRISSPFLNALEKNDFDFFSQHNFIPGFLKLYARYLNLDCQDIIKRYELQSQIHDQQKACQPLPFSLDPNVPIEKAGERKPDPSQRLKKRIILVTLLATALSLLLYVRLVPEEDRGPASFPPVSFQKPVSKDPAQMMRATSPAGPAEKEAFSSKIEGRAGPVTPRDEPTIKMKTEVAGELIPPGPTKMKVIGNRDSKRYHLPGMKYYDKVFAYHRVEFSSEEEAIREGYRKAPQ